MDNKYILNIILINQQYKIKMIVIYQNLNV